MKTVTKIILGSCIFCYFAGIWIIASKFGLVKVFVRYGIADAFEKIPEDFPQIKYLYAGLIAYSIIFVLIAYFICKSSNKAAKEQEELQVQSAEVASYAELMTNLVSRYNRLQNRDARISQKLQMLSRQIASLPPAVVRNANMKSKVCNVITNLDNLLDGDCTPESFSSSIDMARDEIDSLKRISINIKQ